MPWENIKNWDEVKGVKFELFDENSYVYDLLKVNKYNLEKIKKYFIMIKDKNFSDYDKLKFLFKM